MNRSIAKTRNQLQRITYKINQLKTKYTGDSYNPLAGGAENSPSNVKDKQYGQNKVREPMVNTYHNKFNQFNGTKGERVSMGSEEMHQKQFKVFRNEMYNYIDKCLLLNKEKQQQLIQKTIHTHLENSRWGKSCIEERIKKIQEETTDCISNIQDIIVQMKRSQKHFNEKVNHIEQKLRKEFLEESSKVKNRNELDNKNDELFKRIQSVEQQYQRVRQQMQKENINYGNITQKVEKVNCKVEIMEKKFTETKKYNQQLIISKYQNIKKQIERNVLAKIELERKSNTNKEQNTNDNAKLQQIKETMRKYIEQQSFKLNGQIEKNNVQLRNLSQVINQLENQLQNVVTAQNSLQLQVNSFTKSVQAISNRQKNSQLQSEKDKKQIVSAVQQTLQVRMKQFVLNSHFNSKISQIYKQINMKIHQDIEISKQQIEKNVLEGCYEKINIIRKERNSINFQEQISKFKATSIENMKQIQTNLKNTIQEEIQNMLQVQKSSKQTQNSEIGSQKNKHSPKINEVGEIIDEKLNQFENDINQTIKLLYEDIQNRVNEIINSIGVMDLKADFQNSQRYICQLETKVKSLTLLLTTNQSNANPQNTPNQGANSSNCQVNINNSQHRIKQIENVRSQIYQDLGQQIDKISCVLERAVEEMSIKVEKLEHNFSYVYERMSKIQYDNANFKDKLTSLLSGGRPSPFRPEKTYESQMKHNSTILDVLGQLNTGKTFFADA